MMRFLGAVTVGSLIGIAIATFDPDDPCGRKLSSLTIETQADAEIFMGCDRTDRNIIISKNFPGDFTSNIERAGNSVSVGDPTKRPLIEESTLTGVSFPKLNYIGGGLHIAGADGILSLNFPQLEVVQSSITIVDVPSLTTLNIFRRLRYVRYTTISNTGLQTIEWDGLAPEIATTEFYVSNNTDLEVLSIPSLKNMTGGSLYIHGNGKTKLYNRLQEVNFLQVTGFAGWLNGSNGFDLLEFSANSGASDPQYSIWNNSFETLSFPFLEYTNGSISIHDNLELSSLSFPSLYRVNGELEITNNPSLKEMNYSTLGRLQTVSDIEMAGSFESIELPLSRIRPSSLTIESTGNISCTPFDQAWELFWIQSYYRCAANGEKMEFQSNSTRSGSEGAEGGGNGSRNGGGGIGKKGLLAIKVAIPIVGALLWAALIWCLCARRKKRKQQKQAKTAGVEEKGSNDTANLDLNGNVAKTHQGPLGAVVSDREVGNQNQYGNSVPPASGTHRFSTPGAISRAEELDARDRALAERERQILDAREAELAERERKIAEFEVRQGRA